MPVIGREMAATAASVTPIRPKATNLSLITEAIALDRVQNSGTEHQDGDGGGEMGRNHLPGDEIV